MDLIVANDVSRKGSGFGTDTNEVFIIDTKKNIEHYSTTKYEIAEKILNYLI
jgi:phosphopantothenoylcysteine decarboxylase/phosphopantothenate--cysteine ligase